MSNWRFKLIGKFTAISPDGRTLKLPGRKHEALIAYLLLSKRRSVSRKDILTLLWGTRSINQARDSLKGVLYQTTQSLQSHGDPPLDRDRTHIFLISKNMDVDVWNLQSVNEETPLDTLEAYTENLDAELLESMAIKEEAFEDWIEIERQNLARMAAYALTIYGSKLYLLERYTEAANTARRMLSIDNADESAHRLLMQAFFATGNKAMAIQQYRQCADILHSKLNTTVSTETRKLYENINSIEAHRDGAALPDKPATPIALVPKPRSLVTHEIALAVVPFASTSDTESLQPLSQELVEEIIGACARFKWFRVLPSTETNREDLGNKSLANIRQSNAAKYLLNGILRSSNSNIVLNVELVDVETSNLIWSHKLEFVRDDGVFSTTVVPLLASFIDNKLRANEIKYVYGVREEEYTGYECALRAIANLYDLDDRESYRITETLFERAIKTNPNIAWFYSMWSLWKMYGMGQQWVDNIDEEFEKAGHLARQAIKRDADDALAHAINGHYMTFWLRRNDEGRIALDRSLRLNPNSSFALLYSAVNYAYGGNAELALRELERTSKLCNIENHFEFMFDSAYCIAYLINREPEKAAKWGYAAVHENPGFTNGYKQLLVALGHLGDADACKRYLSKLIELDPKFEAKSFLKKYPLVKESDRAYFLEGLEKAKVPTNGNGSKNRLKLV